MIATINSVRSLPPASISPANATSMQNNTRMIFERLKKPTVQALNGTPPGFNFRPLLAMENIIEGGIWAGFWALSAAFTAASLYELYNVLTIEHSAEEKFAKISKAVKAAFVDLISLAGATAYNIHWAHEVKILSLGEYASLVKGLGYGSSLIINLVEGFWSAYNVYLEKEAITNAESPAEQEKHKQRLCLSLLKLSGNICMIAWTALGITTLAVGLTVSPILMGALFISGFAFAMTALFYQRHIEQAPELCPCPSFGSFALSTSPFKS